MGPLNFSLAVCPDASTNPYDYTEVICPKCKSSATTGKVARQSCNCKYVWYSLKLYTQHGEGWLSSKKA